jgi:hypothetical protein
MTFEEKTTWVTVVVGFLVPLAYFAAVLPQLGDSPAADIAYQRTLVVAVAVSIVLTIVGTIAMAIASAIGAEIREPGSADDIGRTDERDTLISRRGDVVGYYVASTGAVIALIVTMLEYDHFWIANTLYLAFVVAGLASGITKLWAYRRGL